jgi:hypothetical protein
LRVWIFHGRWRRWFVRKWNMTVGYHVVDISGTRIIECVMIWALQLQEKDSNFIVLCIADDVEKLCDWCRWYGTLLEKCNAWLDVRLWGDRYCEWLRIKRCGLGCEVGRLRESGIRTTKNDEKMRNLGTLKFHRYGTEAGGGQSSEWSDVPDPTSDRLGVFLSFLGSLLPQAVSTSFSCLLWRKILRLFLALGVVGPHVRLVGLLIV